MKVNAVYHSWEREEDQSVVHAIDHDGGGFVVSSEKVGIAVQNFLNHATCSDIGTLHTHLLYAFRKRWDEESTIIGEAVES